jgi:hypothetical protein
MRAQRLITDVQKNVEIQLLKIFNKCVYYLLIVVETTDITATMHLCIFAHGITSDFEVFEEVVAIQSMQGQTKGLDFLQTLLCNLQKHNLYLSKVLDMFADGVLSLIYSKNSMVSLLYKVWIRSPE